MGVVPVELGPFTGGVNLVDPPVRLSSNELSMCINWRTGIRGEMLKRPGHQYYASNSGSTGRINGDALVNLLLRYYRADGSKKLIGAAGGKLRYGDDALGTWTDISIDGSGVSMHSSNLCDWMVYKNRLYITDGTRVQRYPEPADNNKSIYAGGFVHAAPTLAQPSAGSIPNGTYKYFVTSVTSDMGEGPKGAEASITVAGGPKQVDMSAMAAAPAKHEEVSKNIYRTKVGGSVFYLIANIPTGTTIHSDNAVDSALTEAFIPSHRPPDSSRFVLMGQDDRAYWFGQSGVNASIVDVSEVGFPDRILDGSQGFFAVANNDGDILTGGTLIPGGLVFFKRSSMWLTKGFGSGLVSIQVKEKRGGGVGTVSPFSVVNTPIGVIFLSQRGEVYLFGGTDTTIVGGIDVKEIGREISSEFAGMTEAAMGRVVACYHDYRYIISYDWRGTKEYNWKTLEYNTLTGKWNGPHENGDFYNPSYYSVWNSVLDKGELYWGEAKAGNGSRAYGRLEVTKTDRGNKFTPIYRTGQLNLGKLGEVVSTKAFVDAEFYSDAAMAITHIDEVGRRTSIGLNPPITASPSKWDSGDNLGPGAPVAKFGGVTSTVLEGSFESSARSRKPMYEVTDSGSGVDAKTFAHTILVNVLNPK